MSKITRAIYKAKKEGSKIKANIRLAKNGQFSSIDGIVEELKVSMDGFPYAVFKKKGTKGYQNVRLDNIISVNDGNKIVKK